jgi:hypothetical protein
MKNQYLFFFLFVFSFCSCKKPGCLESAGPVIIMERATSPFHQIDLMDNINVILTQDTAEWIKVEAGKDLQPNIVTTIEKGTLTIRNATTCNWLRNPSEKINVFVGVKQLDYVNYNGSGSITSTNTIIADSITFYSKEGAGNIDVSLEAKRTTATIVYENADFIFRGKSDVCYAYTNARGSFHFEDFEVRHMNIGYASVRDATIHVTEALESLVYHTGNLYYKGNPGYISTHSYSSGKIIRLP